MTQFDVNINTSLGGIDVKTTAVNNEGLPLYHWHTTKDGEVKSDNRETNQTPTQVEPVPIKEVAPTKQPEQTTEPVKEEAPIAEVKTEEKSSPLQTIVTSGFEGGFQVDGKTYLTPEEVEMQRDIAFKIVYFFIAFIIMTFGLLYAYYKVDQKEQEREQREKRTKGIFFDEPNQKTFFDFLAGNLDDENYLTNPNARK